MFSSPCDIPAFVEGRYWSMEPFRIILEKFLLSMMRSLNQVCRSIISDNTYFKIKLLLLNMLLLNYSNQSLLMNGKKQNDEN